MSVSKHHYLFSVLLALSGLITSAYLSYNHFKNFTDISYSSFCALTNSLNCDVVSQSQWSIILGFPLSYWGIIGYAVILIILGGLRISHEQDAPHLWLLLYFLSIAYSLLSLYFFYLSSTRIGTFCILCVLIYTFNFVLLYVCNRVYINNKLSFRKQTVKPFLCLWNNEYIRNGGITLMVSVVIVHQFMPKYWLYDIDIDLNEIPSGITSDYHPWLGSEDPALTIHVFSDYLCFQCFKMNFNLIKLIAANPDKIRLVHHQYPLYHAFNPIVVTTPFHVGSGKLALIAIHAAIEKRFWEVNEALFSIGRQKQSMSIEQISDATGFSTQTLNWALSSEGYRDILAYDIREGDEEKNHIDANRH